MKLFARGLPNGLAAEPADVPEKDGDVAIKLNASTNAARFSGPIQFILKAAEPEKEQAVIAELITPGAENGYNKLVIESTDKLWLTVLPPPKP